MVASVGGMDPIAAVDITSTPEWAALQRVTRPPHLRRLFADDPGRASRYVVEVGDLRIDYSKQRVTDEVLAALNRQGVVPAPGSRADQAGRMQAEIEKWRGVIAAAGPME